MDGRDEGAQESEDCSLMQKQSWQPPVRYVKFFSRGLINVATIVVSSLVLARAEARIAASRNGAAFETSQHHNHSLPNANRNDSHSKLWSVPDGGEHFERIMGSSRLAYVTLLYSDFLHGTRALGQSLRETGTEADIVVLVTPDVTSRTRSTLAKDGWM